MHIDAYVDLDDTLTTWDSLLFSKFHFLKKRWRSDEAIWEFIAPSIKINFSTIKLLQKLWHKNLFILSRNSTQMVTLFIKDYYAIWNCFLVWWKWNILTNEKIQCAQWKPLFSDYNEKRILSNYPLFICVDSVWFFWVFKIYCIKILYYIIFLLKFYVWNRW